MRPEGGAGKPVDSSRAAFGGRRLSSGYPVIALVPRFTTSYVLAVPLER